MAEKWFPNPGALTKHTDSGPSPHASQMNQVGPPEDVLTKAPADPDTANLSNHHNGKTHMNDV